MKSNQWVWCTQGPRGKTKYLLMVLRGESLRKVNHNDQSDCKGISGGHVQELCELGNGGHRIPGEILLPQLLATSDQYKAWCAI